MKTFKQMCPWCRCHSTEETSDRIAFSCGSFIVDGENITPDNIDKQCYKNQRDQALAILDTEAISWAYKKLLDFGVCDSTMENAMMADRVKFMLMISGQLAMPTTEARSKQ